MERGETSSSSSALEDPQSSAASCPVAMAYPSLMAPGPVPVVHHVLVESVENQLPERPVISSSMTCRVSLAIRQTFAAVHLLFKLLTTAITSILQGVAVVGLGATRGVFLLSPSSVLGSCLRCWPTPCSTASRWLPWSSLWRGRSSLQILPHSWRAERLGSQLAAHRTSFAGIMKTVFAILSYGNEFISCYVWILIVWLCGLLDLVCKPATQRCLKIRHCTQPIQPLQKASVSISTFVEFMMFLACMLISCTVQSSRSHDVEWMRDIDDSFLRNKRMNFWVTFIICSLSRVFLRRTGNMLFACNICIFGFSMLCSASVSICRAAFQLISFALVLVSAALSRFCEESSLRGCPRLHRRRHRPRLLQQQLRRFCLLLLMFTLPAYLNIDKIVDMTKMSPKVVGGVFNESPRIIPPHDSLITNLGAVCATASTLTLICRWIIGSLASVCWWIFSLISPPTLRYTVAIKESKREYDIRLKHSATIYRRKEIDRLRSLHPRIKVYSFLNMKSFADRRERLLVRRLVAPVGGWEMFYASTRPDEMRNSSTRFIETVKVVGAGIRKFPSEFYLVVMMLFATSVAASCATCSAAASLLALFSVQVDTALDSFVNDLNDLMPKKTSSRPSACHDKLRIPFFAWILCTVAICLGINLHLHGIDSPVVWDWVARRRVERHEKVIVNVSFAQHAHCQQDTEQPAFQPSVHMAAVNGTILGGSHDQNDAENEIDNSLLQQSVLEAANEPKESFLQRKEKEASQNQHSVPQRRSQGSRRRYKERALKFFLITQTQDGKIL